jgi:predicted ATPase/DNA-binding winged helix-turn-helix (wHTH) protein
MPTKPTVAPPLHFGRFELQPNERRLLLDGHPAHIGARAFDLLLALAERPGRLVDKATLMDLVWPGLVVLENNLAAQMSALRKLLGGEVIVTIPGRGYRFVAPLQVRAEAPMQEAAREPTLRTNLPVELPLLLGRGDALDELGSLIDSHRLVSVIGPGGIGKSLLTQHVLAKRASTYAHGVCWVELGGVRDASALPGAVVAALGVHTGQGDALESLACAVSSLTMLLALDNAEHLLADVATLCRVLHDAAPGLRLIVTSQAPLRLAAEQVCRIGPLAVPDTTVPAAQALQFGAVALFAERAHAVDRRFLVSHANVSAVIDVCRALDGLPLAIELAAARAPLLGLSSLLASMGDRFSLLTQGRKREAPQRQRTLRAALEWSCDLLGPRELRVFRRMGIFAGSASLKLIQQVLSEPDGGELDTWAVLDALDRLVDQSLVVIATSIDADEARYRMLETPRAYALECLDQAGERAELQRRHALAVAALLDAAYEEYFSGRIGVDHWLHRLEADLDNARDAVQWARASGDGGVAMRISTTMLRALPPSLHVERMALADACEAGIADSMPEPLRLKAWIELSCVLADSQKARGRRAAEQALALARPFDARQPDRFGLYHALCRAASAAAQASDLPAASSLLGEAQRLEDPSWPAQRLLWRAEAAQWLARMSGHTGEALQRGRRLLALDRERGSNAALTTGNLIDAELAAGNASAAAQLGRDLIESLSGTRHEYGIAFARINLLAALLAQDDVAQAQPVARSAWSKAATFDLQHAAAAYLALFCALDGRPDAAVKLAAYSQAIYAARQEAREQNETAATLRALSLARPSLDDATFKRLQDEGAAMHDGEVEPLAFGSDARPATGRPS